MAFEITQPLIEDTKPKIQRITLMQKTVIDIYPDGTEHIQKHLCSQWIKEMTQIYKKNKGKTKKKIVKEDTIKEQQEELI